MLVFIMMLLLLVIPIILLTIVNNFQPVSYSDFTPGRENILNLIESNGS